MTKKAKTLFSYTKYKIYLEDRASHEPHEGHGFRKKMAEAVGCQLSYVSHVLGGDRNFSVDQAIALAHFLGLSVNEKEYFIWLVEMERAGTDQARVFFSQLLDKKRDEFFQEKVRVENATEIDEASKATYFSSHIYATIQSLVMIERYQTPQAIAGYMEMDMGTLAKALEFLKTNQLIHEDRGRLKPTSKFISIDRDSPFILQHHTCWRLQAMQSIARRGPQNQHLSFIFTLSDADAKSIRRRLVEMVDEIKTTVGHSNEEKIMAFNLDFFDM